MLGSVCVGGGVLTVLVTDRVPRGGTKTNTHTTKTARTWLHILEAEVRVPLRRARRQQAVLHPRPQHRRRVPHTPGHAPPRAPRHGRRRVRRRRGGRRHRCRDRHVGQRLAPDDGRQPALSPRALPGEHAAAEVEDAVLPGVGGDDLGEERRLEDDLGGVLATAAATAAAVDVVLVVGGQLRLRPDEAVARAVARLLGHRFEQTPVLGGVHRLVLQVVGGE